MLKKIAFVIIVSILISFSYGDDVEQRGRKILDDFYQKYNSDIESVADNFRLRINWAYTACVLFDKGDKTQKADKVLFDTLDPRKTYFSDRGSPGHDLYWELVILCRIANAPELTAKLSEPTKQAIKAVLWDFVYSYDRAGYCDWDLSKVTVIHNSDNHDMIHRSIYLMASQALKDDPLWKEKKYADGQTAADHYQAWVKNLLEYFRFRASTGVNAEFASSVYAALYIQPIFNIYDYCQDKTLSEQSGKFITLFFADAAQETIGGVRGGSRVRVYKTATSYDYRRDRLLSYNHILAAEPSIMPIEVPTDCFTAAYSKYRLPDVVRGLISGTTVKGSYSYISNRLAQGGHILGNEYEVGAQAPVYTPQLQSGLLRYTYASPAYILGTFTVDETKNYMLINSQNQWMGLITAASRQSRLVVNLTPTSDERTGYRELQAVQYKSSAMIRKQLAANDSGLMRLYVSDDLQMTANGAALFFENDSVYTAVICAQQKAQTGYSVEKTDMGPGRFITFNAPDVFIVLETAMKSEYKTLQAFSDDISDNKLQFENNSDIIKYESSKNDCTLTMFTYNQMPEIDGVAVDVRPVKVYDSPYIKGYYNCPIVKITGIDGSNIVLDFDYN